jgi:hypothetical protein
MDRKVFNSHVEEVFDRSRKVMVKKGAEYSGDAEVFHNFNNSIGISLHNTNVGVAWEYLTKHLQSVKDMIEAIEKNGDLGKLNQYLLDEKFGDVINYFLLIEAMIKEKIQNNELKS